MTPMIKTPKLEIQSLDTILKDTTEPPPAIIGDGILLEKSLLLVSGVQKSRKSFLVYNLAIALATGKSTSWIKLMHAYRVLVLSAEGGYFPNRDRLKTMANNHVTEELAQDQLQICFDARIKLNDDTDFEFLKAAIGETNAEVLIIDPLVRFHNVDENSAQEMAFVLGRVRELIQDLGIAVILVHHMGKDQSQGARGSSVILGEYDSFIQINKGDTEQTLDFDMRHVETPEPLTLIFNPDTFWFEQRKDIHPIVALVQERGPLSKKDIVALAIERRILSKSRAYGVIDELLEKKQLFLDGDLYKAGD